MLTVVTALVIIGLVILLILLNSNKSCEDLVIVSSHFNEDLRWLKRSQYRVVVCDKPGAAPMPFQSDARCSMGVNRGREASSYLKFIIEYYDELPKWVAFIHGHEDSEHHKLPYGILEAIDRARKEDHDYISLNNVLQVSGLTDKYLNVDPEVFNIQYWGGRPMHLEMQSIWSEYFEPILGIEFPADLRYQGSAQFIVSREAIRRHPRSVYKKFYDWVTDPSNDDYIAGAVMEFTWHMIFGHKPDICEDEEVCTQDSYIRTHFILDRSN